MAEMHFPPEGTHRVSNSTIVYSLIAGFAVGGPLFTLMGISLFASIGILIVSSPLLIILSPLIFSAGFVLAAAVTGFAAAVAMALGGAWAFTKVYCYVRGRRQMGMLGLPDAEEITESGHRVKHWVGNRQQLVQVSRD
ncbi:oleosin S1-2-like [Aristolochia californica]|uniref:oleosin S1-2-like n=1 Tax=Aristolochia californica TaxID=171875 RepID=UPI0035D76ABE